MKINKLLTVQEGKVEVEGLERFEEGEKVSVTIQRIYQKRSNQQNKYLHSVLFRVPAEEFGSTIDDVKTHLKEKFLSDNAEPIPHIRGTSELSTQEMTEFIRKSRDYMSMEWACYIPSPCSITWLDEYNWITK